jgi:hypothetical protein
MKTPFYGLFRSDNSEVVSSSSVTSRYVPHTTDDVVALAEAAQSAFDDEATAQCHFRNGHFVNIAPSNEYRLAVFGQNDNVFPRVMISAGKVSGTMVSIRHTSNLRPKMTELIDTFEVLKEGWANLQDVITHLEQVDVNIATVLNEVYGKADELEGNKLTRHTNRTEAIVRRILKERFTTQRPTMQNGNVSAFEMYNGIQGYHQHEATRKQSLNNDFDRVLLALNDTSVHKAEDYLLDLVA